MLKPLVDSDFIIDAVFNRNGLGQESKKLWDMIESGQIQGYITEIGLDKIYNMVSNFGSKDDADETVSVIKEIMQVCSIEKSFLEEVRLLSLRDIESAIEVVCAKHWNLGAIITQNPANFAGSHLPVLSLDKLLERQPLESLLDKNDLSHLENLVILKLDLEKNTEKKSKPTIELQSVDLCAAEPHNASLNNVELTGVNLIDTKLPNTKLNGTNPHFNQSATKLREAGLYGTNWQGVDLSEFDLSCIKLVGANLSGANLSEQLSRATLLDTDLCGADLRYADLSYADLRYADLSGANLSDAIVVNAFFVGTVGLTDDMKRDLEQRG